MIFFALHVPVKICSLNSSDHADYMLQKNHKTPFLILKLEFLGSLLKVKNECALQNWLRVLVKKIQKSNFVCLFVNPTRSKLSD